LQDVRPLPHAHFPAEQVPPAHAVPHAPQLAASVWVSTHVVPHWVFGGLQGAVQTPEMQVSLAPHCVPHAPQFAGSMAVFVQAPLHST
jgi:hypothetical protein